MHRRLTRAERLTTRFELAIAVLALGCGNVELVGVDRATVLMADTGARSPALDASAGDVKGSDATAFDAEPARASDDSGAYDGSVHAVWTDPQRPAPFPGQFVGPRSSCPAIEPSNATGCATEGLQCDYPICWGRGKRSWVCIAQQYTLWSDESFLCAAARPCPAESPSQGTLCGLRIECVYPVYCCKGPTGFQPAVCDGQWNLGEPECAGCGEPPLTK